MFNCSYGKKSTLQYESISISFLIFNSFFSDCSREWSADQTQLNMHNIQLIQLCFARPLFFLLFTILASFQSLCLFFSLYLSINLSIYLSISTFLNILVAISLWYYKSNIQIWLALYTNTNIYTQHTHAVIHTHTHSHTHTHTHTHTYIQTFTKLVW